MSCVTVNVDVGWSLVFSLFCLFWTSATAAGFQPVCLLFCCTFSKVQSSTNLFWLQMFLRLMWGLNCDHMTLHLHVLSQEDLQDPAAHPPQLCLWLVYCFTLLHWDSINQLKWPTCEQTVDVDEPLQLWDVTKLSTEICRGSLKAAMLKLSVCLLLTFLLRLLSRNICSECDTELLSGRGEPQHHTGMNAPKHNWHFPWLPFYLLWDEHRSQSLSPVWTTWRFCGPRVLGSTVCRTSLVGQRSPQRWTTQTSCVQTEDWGLRTQAGTLCDVRTNYGVDFGECRLNVSGKLVE